MSVKPIPEGMHSVTPHVAVKGASKAIEFYKAAFGAKEISRSPMLDGRLMHAEIQIGDSRVFLADEFPEMVKDHAAYTNSRISLHIYVPDADSVFNSAVSAGATARMPVADMFWGDRYGQLTDPFGIHWSVATRKENLSVEEMNKRMQAMLAKSA